MNIGLRDAFLSLIRLGIGNESVHGSWFKVHGSDEVDWNALEDLAAQQGLSAILVDGIERLPEDIRPPKLVLLQWIGETLQVESQFAIQQKAAAEMALLFHHNKIRTYVLKGAVVAECYPNQIHRSSSDLDCFLLPEDGDFNAWELGNDLIKNNGFEIETVFYKNSTFFLSGLMVENHQFLTPFRGNKKLKALEKVLQALISKDTGEDKFEGVWLYRPPVMVTALFLVEHAYSHFLHEGLTWKHVLDWMMFRKKHANEISWNDFNAYIDEFGFRKFYDSFFRLGKYLIGEIQNPGFTSQDKMMLADIWAPLDVHDTVRDIKGKLALVGNTWRARWKYKYFSEITWVKALWIQVKGFLFDKHPSFS